MKRVVLALAVFGVLNLAVNTASAAGFEGSVDVTCDAVKPFSFPAQNLGTTSFTLKLSNSSTAVFPDSQRFYSPHLNQDFILPITDSDPENIYPQRYSGGLNLSVYRLGTRARLCSAGMRLYTPPAHPSGGMLELQDLVGESSLQLNPRQVNSVTNFNNCLDPKPLSSIELSVTDTHHLDRFGGSVARVSCKLSNFKFAYVP